jgi:hypothetical protein
MYLNLLQINFYIKKKKAIGFPYCGATGSVSKMASQQEKSFCVLRFEVSRSVITVQHVFCWQFFSGGVISGQK